MGDNVSWTWWIAGPLPGRTVWRRFSNLANQRNTKWTADGLKVNFTWDAGHADIVQHLQDVNLYKYQYYGHGAYGAINTNSSDETSEVGADKYTKYGIAFLGLYACESMDAKGARPDRYSQGYLNGVGGNNPWRMNVSSLGSFEGFTGSVADNLFESLPPPIVLPGGLRKKGYDPAK